MLQRYVDVLHQRIVRREGVEQTLGDAVRIRVKEPDPLWLSCLNRGKTCQQGGQTIPDAEVFAIRGCVLADEVDLTHALRKQARRFADDGFETAAAVLAAVLRYHAERARMVAAFGNFDVREVLGRREYAGREVVVQVRFGGTAGGFIALTKAHDPVQLV